MSHSIFIFSFIHALWCPKFLCLPFFLMFLMSKSMKKLSAAEMPSTMHYPIVFINLSVLKYNVPATKSFSKSMLRSNSSHSFLFMLPSWCPKFIHSHAHPYCPRSMYKITKSTLLLLSNIQLIICYPFFLLISKQSPIFSVPLSYSLTSSPLCVMRAQVRKHQWLSTRNRPSA